MFPHTPVRVALYVGGMSVRFVCVWQCVCMHVCVYLCRYIRIYICKHACMYVSMYACVYVNMSLNTRIQHTYNCIHFCLV